MLVHRRQCEPSVFVGNTLNFVTPCVIGVVLLGISESKVLNLESNFVIQPGIVES